MICDCSPNVRSIVLPKMIDLNELLFLEFILVPYSHFWKKKMKKEKPRVYMEIPIYLCGSQPAPASPDFLTPAEPGVFWIWKLHVLGERKGGEVKGGGNVISVESPAPDSSQKILWLF